MATAKGSAATAAEAQRVPGRSKKRTSASGELMSLDLALAIMRDVSLPLRDRLAAAVAALPYCHPKLAGIRKSETMGIPHEEALKQLAGDFSR